MRAMIITGTGLELRDVAIPRPGPDEVLIRVHAAGLNRAELAMAAGQAHGSHGGAGAGIGLEWSGEVVDVGTAVRHPSCWPRPGHGSCWWTPTAVGRNGLAT